MTASTLMAASAFGSVHGVLHSPAFLLGRDLALCLAAVFWLGLAYWVYRDVRRRSDDPWHVGTATALALTVPYVGPVVYLLFRPPETLGDVRIRTLELHALEGQLGHHALHCPVCRAEVGSDFLVCPVCTTRLKQPCAQCAAVLEPMWQVCPYCAAPVVAGVLQLVAPGLDADLTAEVSRRRRSEPAAPEAVSGRAPAP